MKLPRAVIFGATLWIAAFVVISIVMFTPWFKENMLRVMVVWWILEIPVVFLLAKWYFKADPPTIKKGLLLGLIGLVVSMALDAVITVPLFVKSYAAFYGDWKVWFGLIEVLILCVLAGGEFDKTFTKQS
ncbi:MAG: hypothetical protein HY980_02815 [Candidatus Magasanikbacteria bacterium]|nr:hypothetical protein [Candidatus Magasanikbacteria bacterium]